MKPDPMTRSNFFLPESLLKELRKVAKTRHEGNMSECLRTALTKYFAAVQKAEERREQRAA